MLMAMMMTMMMMMMMIYDDGDEMIMMMMMMMKSAISDGLNGADTDDDDDDCGLSFIHYVSYKYNQQGESARLLQVQSARRISTRYASIKIETLCYE